MTNLISLCMIVKDEEAVLRRCLQSVQQYVDEIVIVDTGSTDRTKEIAREFTDKIYDFKWINDFSAARNEALQYATGKWSLVLDADEYMDEKEIRQLRDLLASKEPNANTIYSLSVISFLGAQGAHTSNEGNVARVFPNHLGFHYTRPIHEQVTSSSDQTMMNYLLPIRIFHTGYVEETISTKDKHTRNLSIFQQMKQQSEWSPYDHLMLGNQYLLMRKYDEALKHLLKALKGSHTLGSNIKTSLLFSIFQVYFNTEKYVDAWIFAEKHLKPYEDYPDTIALRGMILNNLGFIEKTKETYHLAIQKAEERTRTNQDLCIVSPDMATTVPMKQLVFLYEKEKNFTKMVHYLTQILMTDSRDIDSLTKLIQILSLQKDGKGTIVPFLNKLLRVDDDPLMPLLISKISITLGYTHLAKVYMDQLSSADTLPLSDRLRYAILTNDKTGFERQWIHSTDLDRTLPSNLDNRILGALAWGEENWIAPVTLPSDHVSHKYLCWAISLLRDNFPSETINSHSGFSLKALSDLYSLNQLETFDLIIDHVSSTELINALANFFYTRHDQSNALQYYSHLNEQGQLDLISCVNLTYNSLNEHSTEDALLFLDRAISLAPNQKQLYIMYYALCLDPVKKKQMIQQLYIVDRRFKELSLLQS